MYANLGGSFPALNYCFVLKELPYDKNISFYILSPIQKDKITTKTQRY